MMRSTFFGLEIGRTGLNTAQFGLDVTSHNISNLDTDGYTRQRIVSTAHDPFATVGRFAPVGQGLVGGGVRVQILDQIRSAYLDRRFRTESTSNAYWETRTQSLSYIESFFDNVNEKTSINFSMAEFFRAMTIVSHDPVSGAPRTLMQTAAMDLVQQLNMIYDGLMDFQKVENRAVETKVGDINEMAEKLRDLNIAIYTFEITGMIANDLRDKRQLLIDELARYIDVEYEEYPDKFGHSMMRISIAGETLVDHDRFNTLGIIQTENPIPGEDTVSTPFWNHLGFINSLGELENYHTIFDAKLDWSKVTGGEVKAHKDMRDGVGGGVDGRNRGIPYYVEMVNDLARALVFEINSQHVQGWSDNPNEPGGGSATGILFFDDGVDRSATDGRWDPADGDYFLTEDQLRSITAKSITLSKDIQDSAFNIAASSVQIERQGLPEDQQRGNNVNMLELYKLFSKPGITMLGRDIGTFDDYGTVIRFDVGNTLNSAKQAADTSRILTLAANNQRTAIAGVSLDEEMVGLVKYNHAYNGAARVITAMDDALDRLINGTGRVGL